MSSGNSESLTAIGQARSVQASIAGLGLQGHLPVFPGGPVAPPLLGLVPEVAEGHLSPFQFSVESAVGLVEVADEVEDAPRLEVLGSVAEAVEEAGHHDVFSRGPILAHLDLAPVARPALRLLVGESLVQGTPEGRHGLCETLSGRVPGGGIAKRIERVVGEWVHGRVGVKIESFEKATEKRLAGSTPFTLPYSIRHNISRGDS